MIWKERMIATMKMKITHTNGIFFLGISIVNSIVHHFIVLESNCAIYNVLLNCDFVM